MQPSVQVDSTFSTDVIMLTCVDRIAKLHDERRYANAKRE